jgi:hypothetical protein
MYAFHCKVPAGADALEVSLTYLAPPATGGFSSGASTSAQLAVLNWNQLLLYSKGPPTRDVHVRASVRLPQGWKAASPLPTPKQKGVLGSGDYYHTFKLDYHGGSRYACLERDSATADLLSAITQPLAPNHETQAAK